MSQIPNMLESTIQKIREMVDVNSVIGEPISTPVGGGVKVTPICFLIVKDGNVRMMPVAEPASSTADRIVEMVPDTLDKLTAYLDSKKKD